MLKTSGMALFSTFSSSIASKNNQYPQNTGSTRKWVPSRSSSNVYTEFIDENQQVDNRNYNANTFETEQLQQESLMAKTPVTIVRTAEDAIRCVEILEAHPEAIWACDTEVIDIDIKEQSPVGNGKVICVSIYGGDAIDFGSGSTLWIENAGEAENIIQYFKGWFENPKYKKVWHNYGFDRHVMGNEGIQCQGFYGDTMHMARLWDTSRDKMAAGGGNGEGYSLASLTSSLFQNHIKSAYFVKSSMIDLFGVAKLKKDGSESKKKELPDLLLLQTEPQFREKWIEYSARDAVATWWLHDALVERLKLMPWIVQHRPNEKIGSMFDFYQSYLKDFGQLLTDMEHNGIKVDTKNHLRKAEFAAREERDKMQKLFIEWATEMCPAARDINIASTTQIQQLLFGHYEGYELIGRERIFQIEKSAEELLEAQSLALATNPFALLSTAEVKEKCKAYGLKTTGKREELVAGLLLYEKDSTAAITQYGTVQSKKQLLPSTETGEKYYQKLKLADLQGLCETRGLTVRPIHAISEQTSETATENTKKVKKVKAPKAIKPKKSDYIEALLQADRLEASIDAAPTASQTATSIASISTEEYTTEEILEHFSPEKLLNFLHVRHLQWSGNTRHHSREELLAMIKVIRDYDTLLSMKSETYSTVEALFQVASSAPYKMDMSHLENPNLILQHMTAIDISLQSDYHHLVYFDQYNNTLTPPMENFEDFSFRRRSSIASVSAASDSTAAAAADTANPVPPLASSTSEVGVSPSQLLKKKRDFTIATIGMEPVEFTSTGLPQVSAPVLKKLAGKNVFSENEADIVWGTAYEFFGGGEAGKKACRAIGALAAVGQVDATINNFLVPLQALVDKKQRIHCSLNLNTETGRLSSRRPNLQNQPALEKDQYKIRDAFVAEEGNTFIVADYGQLELRILAHITNCQSMIDAFEQGGCFHSRTAVGMYPYIAEAVENGQVMLEWDYSKGQPTVPLVKDTYASERRKAKTLNFSIAYGKTVHGLAADWGITKEEAEETLDAWYRDRPEVKEWQLRTQALAQQKGYVCTMMGRYRRLPDALVPSNNNDNAMGQKNSNNQPSSSNKAAMGHALRAAINTPIQGSAADVVMMAMLKLWRSEVLKKLGWKLLLQIHDEVILEGPKECVDEAMQEVRHCMENPFDNVGLKKLLVHLDVDAKSADTWYKAK